MRASSHVRAVTRLLPAEIATENVFGESGRKATLWPLTLPAEGR